MAALNDRLELIQGSGWNRGLGNHLRGELRRWFGSRKWWSQILVFALVINLLLVVIISDPPDVADPFEYSILFFNGAFGVVGAIGVVILTQGALVGEKRSGTAEWVLSKPISRPAFYLAKLIANAVGAMVTIVLAQGLIAYVLISFGLDTAVSPLAFLAALVPQAVNLLFYLTLTLMLGAIFNRWGPVVAIPIVPLFLDEIIIALAPPGLLDLLTKVLPWGLATGYGDLAPSIAGSIMLGHQPYSLSPILWTLGFSALFVGIGVWVFRRQEF